ncbi:MAG: oligosaccharide flippase family protein [Sedimentisphaerales bacterium]|nr:oligosaccharide flippase family protein [Sedimentisphaerales bacterium]
MRSLTTDIATTFASRLVVLITGLGVEACLAWLLHPAGRGSYAVCLVFSALLQTVFLTGWNMASVYFVASKRLSLSEGVTQAFVYGLISSSLAIVAGLLLMRLPWAFFDAADATSFHLALLLIPSTFFALVFLQLLTAVHDFRWFAGMSVLNGVSFLLLALVFVGGLSLDVHGALLACILRQWLVVVAIVLFFRWKYGVKLMWPSLRRMREVFYYGLRYHVGQIANNANVQVGTIILAMFATRVEVGYMAVAAQLMTTGVMVIPDTIMTVLLPKVSEDVTGRPQLIARCARLTGLACALSILVLAGFATPIVRWLFSPSFLPIVPLIRILAVGTLVRCTCKVFTSYLHGTNHPGIDSLAVATGVAVNLVVLWLLMPVIGLPAAALAMTLSYVISSAIITLGFLKLSRLGPLETFRLARSDLAVVRQAVTRLFPRWGWRSVLLR